MKLQNSLTDVIQQGFRHLEDNDPDVYQLLEKEMHRQSTTLSLVASCGGTSSSALAASSSTIVNVTAEGYPGNRYHAGCEIVDQIENLAIQRAMRLFGAKFANVQPHCASSANHAVMHAVLKPGDRVIGMALEEGGHLTHGASVNSSGKIYDVKHYGLDSNGQIDFKILRQLAHAHRPKLIICGTTSYTRFIDFDKFRNIADEVGALLLADVTHIAGLIAAGLHPSSIDAAHFTTLCTYKQLYGPRGGLILMGDDHAIRWDGGKLTLSELIQKSVFPGLQGSPATSQIAAKAVALSLADKPEFKRKMRKITDNAKFLAGSLARNGYHVCSGGTDNHMVLIKLPEPLTGIIAQRALEQTGIIVNKNKIPGDQRNSQITSGIRLGSNTVALRNMGESEMQLCADLVHRVLSSVIVLSDTQFELPSIVARDVKQEVTLLCNRFPLPYPLGECAENVPAE